jgi:hypothetical protein
MALAVRDRSPDTVRTLQSTADGSVAAAPLVFDLT